MKNTTNRIAERTRTDVQEERYGCATAIPSQPLPGHDRMVGEPR